MPANTRKTADLNNKILPKNEWKFPKFKVNIFAELKLGGSSGQQFSCSNPW